MLAKVMVERLLRQIESGLREARPSPMLDVVITPRQDVVEVGKTDEGEQA